MHISSTGHDFYTISMAHVDSLRMETDVLRFPHGSITNAEMKM